VAAALPREYGVVVAGRFFRRRRRKLIAIAAAPLPLGPRLELLQVGLGTSDSWQEIPVERETDWPALLDVVVDRDYEADYEDAEVVDCGAYKGFYGAYVLARGAAAVVSYEPATGNFEALERAASGRGRWRTVQAAIGGHDAIAKLVPAGDSWAVELGEVQGEFEPVRVLALADVLARAVRQAAGTRLIVKLDIGRAEAEVLLETPPEVWRGVSTVLVETHGTEETVAARLGAAGFRLAGRSNAVLHFASA
jgi:FkbM family methyltransferase